MFMDIAVARAQGRGRRFLTIQVSASIGTLAVDAFLALVIGAEGIAIGGLSPSAIAVGVALRGPLPVITRARPVHVV